MIRLFVALEIPSPVCERLLALQGGVSGARWLDREQLHLTLRFIGEVSESTAGDIDDALTGVRVPGFALALAGVGAFGGKAPRSLWAGVRASSELVHLQRKIENALQRLGLSAEQRKFTPHVTLARLRDPPRAQVQEFLTTVALFSSGDFLVDGFALFSSELASSGAIYRVERNYPLAA